MPKAAFVLYLPTRTAGRTVAMFVDPVGLLGKIRVVHRGGLLRLEHRLDSGRHCFACLLACLLIYRFYGEQEGLGELAFFLVLNKEGGWMLETEPD